MNNFKCMNKRIRIRKIANYFLHLLFNIYIN